VSRRACDWLRNEAQCQRRRLHGGESFPLVRRYAGLSVNKRKFWSILKVPRLPHTDGMLPAEVSLSGHLLGTSIKQEAQKASTLIYYTPPRSGEGFVSFLASARSEQPAPTARKGSKGFSLFSFKVLVYKESPRSENGKTVFPRSTFQVPPAQNKINKGSLASLGGDVLLSKKNKCVWYSRTPHMPLFSARTLLCFPKETTNTFCSSSLGLSDLGASERGKTLCRFPKKLQRRRTSSSLSVDQTPTNDVNRTRTNEHLTLTLRSAPKVQFWACNVPR
jgi:hypothetical protein